MQENLSQIFLNRSIIFSKRSIKKEAIRLCGRNVFLFRPNSRNKKLVKRLVRESIISRNFTFWPRDKQKQTMINCPLPKIKFSRF